MDSYDNNKGAAVGETIDEHYGKQRILRMVPVGMTINVMT
jgi:hypothetical protein